MDKKKTYYNSLYNGITPKFPYTSMKKGDSLLSPDSRNSKRAGGFTEKKESRAVKSYTHT